MATSFKIDALKQLKIQKQAERNAEKIAQQIKVAAKKQKSEANAKRIKDKMDRIAKGEINKPIKEILEVIEEVAEEIVEPVEEVVVKDAPKKKKKSTKPKSKK